MIELFLREQTGRPSRFEGCDIIGANRTDKTDMDKKQGITIVIGTLLVGFLIGMPVLILKGRKMVSPIPEDSEVKVIFVSPKVSPTEEASPSATVIPEEEEPTLTPEPKATATPTPEEEPTATPTPEEEPTATQTPQETP